jgi:hypothetical protein
MMSEDDHTRSRFIVRKETVHWAGPAMAKAVDDIAVERMEPLGIGAGSCPGDRPGGRPRRSGCTRARERMRGDSDSGDGDRPAGLQQRPRLPASCASLLAGIGSPTAHRSCRWETAARRIATTLYDGTVRQHQVSCLASCLPPTAHMPIESHPGASTLGVTSTASAGSCPPTPGSSLERCAAISCAVCWGEED